MRLTPSSSLLIATLALSSSSSSLAAPTDHDVNGLSTSSSIHGIHSSREDSIGVHVGNGNVELGVEQGQRQRQPDHEEHRALEKRLDLGAVLGGVPILGPALAPLLPALEPIFNALGLGDGGSGGPSSLLALSPGQVSQVQQAVAQAIISAGPSNITGIASSLPVPPLPTGAAGNITANVPVRKRDDNCGGNMASADCSSSPDSSSATSTWSPVSTFAEFSAPSDVPLNSPPGPAEFAAPSGLPVSPPSGLPVSPPSGLPVSPPGGLPVSPPSGLPVSPPNGLPVSPPIGSLPVGANPLSPSLPVNPPNTPIAPPVPVGAPLGASSSTSSAGTTPTTSPDAIDVQDDTTPPLFMSSTAGANSSPTA